MADQKRGLQKKREFSKPRPYKEREAFPKKAEKNMFILHYDKLFGKGTYDKLLFLQKSYENKAVRINLSKTTFKEVQQEFSKNRIKVSSTFLPNALLIVKSYCSPASTLLALSAKIYPQDIASQIPVATIPHSILANPLPLKILDMAAAPGSKTTQLADMLTYLGTPYHITALEPEQKRLTKLMNNIQKHNFKNITVRNVLGEEFESTEQFDLILLDAPCSGNMVADKNWTRKRTISGIEQRAVLQKKLLEKAVSLLSRGGLLLYSTCSLEVQENEENVAWALKYLPLSLEKIQHSFQFETKPQYILKRKQILDEMPKAVLSKTVRLHPPLSGTQGFFLAHFKKK